MEYAYLAITRTEIGVVITKFGRKTKKGLVTTTVVTNAIKGIVGRSVTNGRIIVETTCVTYTLSTGRRHANLECRIRVQ